MANVGRCRTLECCDLMSHFIQYSSLQVLQQVDNKFIACLVDTKNERTDKKGEILAAGVGRDKMGYRRY